MATAVRDNDNGSAVTGDCKGSAPLSTCPSTAGQWSEMDPPRKPMRKRFDEEMDRLNSVIKIKEEELHKLLLDPSQPPVSPGQSMTSVWQQRDETIARRRAIDERLQAANKEIANKRDAVARIHSKLNYKSEDRINEAIKRLEYQLRVNNFKVNEERRIVKEIDTLSRSRRNLKEYSDKKAELDAALKQQQEMRNERDALFRTLTGLNQTAESMKREHKEKKIKAEALKKELDELYGQKRQKLNNYRQNFSKYQQYRAQVKRQFQKHEEPTKKEDLECIPLAAYSEECQLCVTLLSYLQRFEFSQVTSAMTPNNDFLPILQLPASEGHTPVTPTEEVTLIRRKEESGDEDWCLYSSGRGARAKRNHTKKLRQQLKKKKPVTHTPEVFEQFSRLQLCAPSLLTEVPVAIEQLKAKKKFYEHLSQAGILEEIPDLPLYSLSIASADAKTQNATTESQDVTPYPEPKKEQGIPTLLEPESQDIPSQCQDVMSTQKPAKVQNFPKDQDSLKVHDFPKVQDDSLSPKPTEVQQDFPAVQDQATFLSQDVSPSEVAQDFSKVQGESKDNATVLSTTNNPTTLPVVIANVPKSLNLERRDYDVLMNGFKDELDDLDMGYSSENGYSKYERRKNGLKILQTIES